MTMWAHRGVGTYKYTNQERERERERQRERPHVVACPGGVSPSLMESGIYTNLWHSCMRALREWCRSDALSLCASPSD